MSSPSARTAARSSCGARRSRPSPRSSPWPGAPSPNPYFAKYGNNLWAASQQYLAAVVAYASGPVIKKYLGVLAAADVYTASTTFAILESVRLDLGVGSQVHP